MNNDKIKLLNKASVAFIIIFAVLLLVQVLAARLHSVQESKYNLIFIATIAYPLILCGLCIFKIFALRKSMIKPADGLIKRSNYLRGIENRLVIVYVAASLFYRTFYLLPEVDCGYNCADQTLTIQQQVASAAFVLLSYGLIFVMYKLLVTNKLKTNDKS